MQSGEYLCKTLPLSLSDPGAQPSPPLQSQQQPQHIKQSFRINRVNPHPLSGVRAHTIMNNTYFKHLAVTGVAGGTRPRGSLALIHDSQPQARRHWYKTARSAHRHERKASRCGGWVPSTRQPPAPSASSTLNVISRPTSRRWTPDRRQRARLSRSNGTDAGGAWARHGRLSRTDQRPATGRGRHAGASALARL